MISANPGLRVHNAGPVDRIPLGEGRAFRAADEDVAIFRTRAGNVYALQANCTHAGGPLFDGLIGDGRVLCPLHGHAFVLESGEPIGHSCPKLRTYPVQFTDDGDILIEAPPCGGPDRCP